MGGELISTEELVRILHEPDLRIFYCTTRNRREGRTLSHLHAREALAALIAKFERAARSW